MRKNISKVAYDIISSSRFPNSLAEIIKGVNKFNVGDNKVKDLKAEVERIFAIKAKRSEYKEFCKLTFRQILWGKYQAKADKMARYIPSAGYTMGQFSTLCVLKTPLLGNWNNAEEYAKSCKYRATHGYVRLNLTAKEFLKSEIVGGIITIYGKKISKDLFTCKWIEGRGSKQNTNCARVNGYIHRDYHFTAADSKDAIAIAKKRKEEIIIRELREKNELKLRQLCEKLPLHRIFVQLDDSLNSGNCLAGTTAFARKIGIDLAATGAVRADYIFENRTGVEGFALKAINQAKMRYATNNLI